MRRVMRMELLVNEVRSDRFTGHQRERHIITTSHNGSFTGHLLPQCFSWPALAGRSSHDSKRSPPLSSQSTITIGLCTSHACMHACIHDHHHLVHLACMHACMHTRSPSPCAPRICQDGWIDRAAFGWLPSSYLRMMPRFAVRALAVHFAADTTPSIPLLTYATYATYRHLRHLRHLRH